MIVVDASVLVTALADDAADGDRARARLRGQALAAPSLVDIEVVSALRRLVARDEMCSLRAGSAISDLRALPVQRVAHLPLLERIWQLRASVTTYEASYVALAEALEAVLLTADARLSRASGVRCPVEVLTGGLG